MSGSASEGQRRGFLASVMPQAVELMREQEELERLGQEAAARMSPCQRALACNMQVVLMGMPDWHEKWLAIATHCDGCRFLPCAVNEAHLQCPGAAALNAITETEVKH